MKKIEEVDSESKSLRGGEEAKNVLQAAPIDQAKNVLQTVPTDEGLISMSISAIENVQIFSNTSDNHIGWSSGSQEKGNVLSTASMNKKKEMNMNEITNCSNQTGLGRIGHVLESISRDIIEIEENNLLSFSKDLTSSGIRSIASAPSTFNPPAADPFAASLVVSANVLGARDEYGLGSRRSAVTSSLSNQFNSSHSHSNNHSNDDNNNNDSSNSKKNNNNNYKMEPKPKHTGTSPSVVMSSEVNLVNLENCRNGDHRQVSSNRSPIAFEIFKHPDDVVWGLDARSGPPHGVSRLICGIIEGEVRAPEGRTICSKTQGTSSGHDSSIKYDDGSHSQDILSLSHSVQSADLARTLDLVLSPASTPVPVFSSFRTLNTLPAHVPVDLPISALDDDANKLKFCGLHSMTAIVTQLKGDPGRGSDNEELAVRDTRRDGDTIIAVRGELEGRVSDTFYGKEKDKEKEWKSCSFVPRTRSKVRCSAPTYQATSSPSRNYLEEEKVLSGRYKACSATDGINSWIEESCEGEMEEEGAQEETVLSIIDISLSHDANRKSSTAPASIHTHSQRGVYIVLSVLLVNPLPNPQFSTKYFTTLPPPFPLPPLSSVRLHVCVLVPLFHTPYSLLSISEWPLRFVCSFTVDVLKNVFVLMI